MTGGGGGTNRGGSGNGNAAVDFDVGDGRAGGGGDESQFDGDGGVVVGAAPWQYRWKRPRVCRPAAGGRPTSTRDEEDDVVVGAFGGGGGGLREGMVPVSSASAFLTASEARSVLRPGHRRRRLNREESSSEWDGIIDRDFGGERSSSASSSHSSEWEDCVLTVTVFATEEEDVDDDFGGVGVGGNGEAPAGDVVLLEVTSSSSSSSVPPPVSTSEGSSQNDEEEGDDDDEEEGDSEANGGSGGGRTTTSSSSSQPDATVRLSRTLRWPSAALVPIRPPPPSPLSPPDAVAAEDEREREEGGETAEGGTDRGKTTIPTTTTAASDGGGESHWGKIVRLFGGGRRPARGGGGGDTGGASKKRRKRVGVVSASLCRRQRDGGRGGNVSDAIDALRLMTLGLVDSFSGIPDEEMDDEEEADGEVEGGGGAATTNDAKKDGGGKGGGGTMAEEEEPDRRTLLAARGRDGDGGGGGGGGDVGGGPTETELSLCCLADDGRVHVFDAVRLLLLSDGRRNGGGSGGGSGGGGTEGRPENDDEEEEEEEGWMTTGLATLLLGKGLHDELRRTMLPLSRPVATVELSVARGAATTTATAASKGAAAIGAASAAAGVAREGADVNDDDAAAPSTIASGDARRGPEEQEQIGRSREVRGDDNDGTAEEEDDLDDDEEDDEDPTTPLLDLSTFDANVEPTTVRYRTEGNVPTISAPAFDYVAIGGRGVRRRRRKVLVDLAPTSTTTVGTTGGGVGGEAAAKVEATDDGGKKPAAATTLAAAGPASKPKRKWETYLEPGGFVTFVSLLHRSEARTIYLPFPPKSLHPVVWNGMEFVVVLADDDDDEDDDGRRRRGERDRGGGDDARPRRARRCRRASTATSSSRPRPPAAMAVRVDSDAGSAQPLLSKDASSSPEELSAVGVGSATPFAAAASTFVESTVSLDALAVAAAAMADGGDGDDDVGAAAFAAVARDRRGGPNVDRRGGGGGGRNDETRETKAMKKKKRRRRKVCRVARFRPLPVVLDLDDAPAVGTGGGGGGRGRRRRGRYDDGTTDVAVAALGVTSALASPPGVVVSYSCRPSSSSGEEARPTAVALHTLRGFEYVPDRTVLHVVGRTGRRGRSGNALDDGGGTTTTLAIRTARRPGHVATLVSGVTRKSDSSDGREDAPSGGRGDGGMWCTAGQGWSLVGIRNAMHFVCWEGATASYGAFATELRPTIPPRGATTGGPSSGRRPPPPRTYAPTSRTACSVLPPPSANGGGRRSRASSSSAAAVRSLDGTTTTTKSFRLPFTSTYRAPTLIATGRRDVVDAVVVPADPYRPTAGANFDADDGSELDDIVVDALGSIAVGTASSSASAPHSVGDGRRRRMTLSHVEKSRRLLRRCSSWTRLDGTKENRALVDGQVIISTFRFGPLPQHHLTLTMRRNVFKNGVATPFYHVLAWLCQKEDYYTAASIALDLLRDVVALRDLRGCQSASEDVDEQSFLEGLLDGIIPIDCTVVEGQQPTGGSSVAMESLKKSGAVSQDQQQSQHSTVTSLADMTVGCLVKGGLGMAQTLEGFLGRNAFYDASRASLMLVATAACSVSGDKEALREVMGSTFDGVLPIESILWPIRCLLQVAVTRESMPTALLLLNGTIPWEIRGKTRKKSKEARAHSLDLCKEIVTMIVASSENAAGYLLSMIDDVSKTSYWQSLDHETQLALSLISICGKYPLLREVEVRFWALEQLNLCIEEGDPSSDEISSPLPSDWLIELCSACLSNAECNVMLLSMALTDPSDPNDPSFASPGETDSDEAIDTNYDGIQRHLEEINLSRNLLVASPGSGGLDFDLIIPALLLLRNRSVQWHEGVYITTQSILDAACYLAGRHFPEEPAFAFDGATVMRQCAVAENVSAGANLIGGRDGLILKCCDILMEGKGMSMDTAERLLMKEAILKKTGRRKSKGLKRKTNTTSHFNLTEEHRHVLWLLDEHVLSVKTYGEFETVHIRGRVHPVFAARLCLKTWFYLAPHDSKDAACWLVSWLRKGLGIAANGSISRKRLACAALSRALLWPESGTVDSKTEGDPTYLGNVLGIECKFLIELAQSCCGLIESLPPSVAEEVLADVRGSAELAFGTPSVQVDVAFVQTRCQVAVRDPDPGLGKNGFLGQFAGLFVGFGARQIS